MKALLSKIGDHYDKLLAIVAILGLFVSLIYLAVQVGMDNAQNKEFNTMLRNIKIAHKNVSSIETDEFEEARTAVRDSLTIDYSTWTNKPMLVLADRVTCEDCKLPIPYSANVCPFCLAAQQEELAVREGYDHDKDGIPDKDEKAYGMDRKDPSDALEDMDGDGFSNLAEHRAGKDPADEEDYPPPSAELYLTKIHANPFMLRFKSVMTLPDKKLKFGLNLKMGRNRVKTYFAKQGEEVEGFVLSEYESKKAMRVKPGFGDTPQQVDVSELTLTKADKEIVLIKGEDVQHNEYIVSFWFKLKDTKFDLHIGDEFKLLEEKYSLKSIDTESKSVVIVRLVDGESISIRRYDTAAEEESE